MYPYNSISTKYMRISVIFPLSFYIWIHDDGIQEPRAWILADWSIQFFPNVVLEEKLDMIKWISPFKCQAPELYSYVDT